MRILERHTKSSALYLFGLAASGLSGVVGYQCNLLRIIFEYHKKPSLEFARDAKTKSLSSSRGSGNGVRPEPPEVGSPSTVESAAIG